MKHKGSLSPILVLFLLLALLVPSGFGPTRGASAQEPEPTPAIGPGGGGMPGYPRPAKPIPHHEPGQPSRAGGYRTQVVRENELGALEVVEISGVDAMAADGIDPLAGNYTLVNLDKIMMSWNANNQTSLQTFTPTLSIIPGSERILDNYRSNDIAAGDLNSDGQDEQIAAWIEPTSPATGIVKMSIGEMPGSLGRTTSAPAAVVHTNGSIDLVVRGYDDALWHRHSNNGQDWLPWQRLPSSLPLLSGPAIASNRDGAFRVFAIGPDNQIWERDYNGSTWSDNWVQTAADTETWPALKAWRGPTPELPAPAAVARGSRIDLFRLGPDNTLRWQHSDDGITWQAWQNLGGMISSGLGAVSQNDHHIQVFARGVDEALWHRTYNGTDWDPWQRLERSTQMKNEGVTIASAPTVISDSEIYVRGLYNALWHYDGSSWHKLGGELVSGVAVAAGAWKFIAQADDGSLQYSQNGSDSDWNPWDGLMPCCMTYDTGLSGQIKDVSPFEDYSLDVETGYFLGDGRSQIVVAYLSESNPVTPTIALYQIGGGFIPQLADQVQLGHDVDYFSITTGDFLDRDGIDEVALAYVLGQSYGVDIIRLSSGGSGVAIESVPMTDDTRCWDNDNPMKFAGTLEVASGDFDADGQDEIAITVLFNCEDYYTYRSCHTYRYHARTRIYDVTGSTELSAYYVEDEWGAEVRRNTGEWSVGLTIAAGDVDGDGQDELVRTWPVEFGDSWWTGCGVAEYYERNDQFMRKLQVYKLPTAAWPDGGGKIEITPFYETGGMGYTSNSYVDRVAVGDLDQDIKGELVWHIGTNADRILRTYDYVVPDSGDPYFDPLDAHLTFVYYPNLVTGDFTREGVRVGPPSYRVQNRVDTLVAHLNMPPKHRDLVKDAQGNYQLVESPEGECSPSPDSPDCTHAKYAKQDFESTEQTIRTEHQYQISAWFKLA
jgi:hypothetical protein